MKQITSDPDGLLNNIWHCESRWLSPFTALYSVACVITEAIPDKAAGHVAVKTQQRQSIQICLQATVAGESQNGIVMFIILTASLIFIIESARQMIAGNLPESWYGKQPQKLQPILGWISPAQCCIGSIPTHISTFSQLIFLTEFLYFGISYIPSVHIMPGQHVYHIKCIILYHKCQKMWNCVLKCSQKTQNIHKSKVITFNVAKWKTGNDSLLFCLCMCRRT